MIPMRRKNREVTDPEQIREILNACKVVRLAAADAEGIYIIPMNYGYEYDGKELTFYFHSAKEGRKIDAFASNPEVGFELDCEHALVEGKVPCAYGYSYRSIIGNGKIEFLDSYEDRLHALQSLMLHQTGKTFEFTSLHLSAIALFRLRARSFCAKANKK